VSTATPTAYLDQIAGGAQVVVRDEEWLVRSVQQTPSDGLMVRCTGTSSLVRDTDATFFTNLDLVEPLRPEDTVLVPDETPNYRGSRLYLESIIRKTPVPATESRLTVASGQLLNELQYQRRAAAKAFEGLRPRLLIADAVGLGKTLEVGLILSELIRRGRGERILVVTPRHILEQFQHEMWTRFAIPLVRLDSEGIQRVRRRIPAGRNPFTYYKRAIISIDTLKNAGRYRHHLEGIRWDAVVIDECHNVMNRSAARNHLVRVLAPRTDALLMLSATPHNGDPESFAELIRLLDPTAIADPKAVKPENIEHLYVRRHKGNAEVAAEAGSKWADRLPPKPIPIEPTPAEEAMFAEIAEVWTHPPAGTKAPTSGTGSTLFPWTLFKAALSSHRALAETVRNRRKNLRVSNGELIDTAREAEDEALARLAELADAVDDTNASKLTALVEQLRSIGLDGQSSTRCVVFSERIATLDWLAEQVPKALGMSADQVRVLHGGMADVRQMDVIEEFGLGESPVRLLLTGDMASEGVNLHRECHHLIHFDLPWSLITIEQRNGRIDRYGQEERPDIRALIVTPDSASGDVRVLSKLLEREDTAHRAFGESGALLGLHTAALEEEAISKALRDGTDPDEAIPEQPADAFDLLTLLTKGTGTEPVQEAELPSLFDSTFDFVTEALQVAVEDHTVLDVRTDASDPTFLSIATPPDLARRLSALPQSYLSEQGLTERIKVTADRDVAQRRLDAARASTDSTWPDVAYLSPLHPLMDWLVDKLLVQVGRNQAPMIEASVDVPTFCVQGLWSNGQGRPQLVEWLAVSPVDGQHRIEDMFEVLRRAGVGPGMPNTGRDLDPAPLTAALQGVVEASRDELRRRRAEHDARVEELLNPPAQRLGEWVQRSNQLAFQLDDRRRSQRERHVGEVRNDTERLIESLRTTGDPMIRVLAVLVPQGGA
jgi:superfamily II DNA or RNA helicase